MVINNKRKIVAPDRKIIEEREEVATSVLLCKEGEYMQGELL